MRGRRTRLGSPNRVTSLLLLATPKGFGTAEANMLAKTRESSAGASPLCRASAAHEYDDGASALSVAPPQIHGARSFTK